MKPYYDDGRGIVIYHGDCREVLPMLAQGCADAVITDPPYGTTACAWDTAIPFDAMWSDLKRLIKPRSAVVLFSSQPFTSALVMSNPAWFRHEWVWDKRQTTGAGTAGYMPLKAHETILVFGESGVAYYPQFQPESTIKAFGRHVSGPTNILGGFDMARSRRNVGYPKSIITVPRPNNITGDGGLHPTQKPIKLLEYLVLTYSRPGEVVLDFSMGSGTTLRAAKDLGRRAIGIEIDERYCEIAAHRLSQEVMALE